MTPAGRSSIPSEAEQFDAAQARLKADKPADTLLTALLAVQKELPSISLQKTGKNPAFKSKYLTLDGLHAAILPLLNKHGLVWACFPSERQEEAPSLYYAIMHAATGEKLEGWMPLMLDKQNSQGLGSAITYARRYSLLSVIGAVGDEDDDGNAASRDRKPPAPVEQATIARNTEDRPLTDDELKAMRAAIVTSGLDEPLLLASVGCEGKVLLSHARLIRAKLDA